MELNLKPNDRIANVHLFLSRVWLRTYIIEFWSLLFWILGRGLRRALIRCTLGSGKSEKGLGFWRGGHKGAMCNKEGAVYRQPGTEVDDSCHNWRVPSK